MSKPQALKGKKGERLCYAFRMSNRKKPILIWRLKNAPLESFKDDIFWENEEGYRKWRAGKSGDEFVAMVPESWAFDDADAAYALGLNVTEDMRSFDFSGEPNPDCEAFAHCHYEGSTYEVYIVPALTGRDHSQRTEEAGGD